MPAATQTAPSKATIADVARFAHVSVQDVEAAAKNPASVTSETLAVVREAAQEVGFDLTVRQPRRRAPRAPRDPNTTRSGLRKLNPRQLTEQGRKQAVAELADAVAATRAHDGVTAPGTKASDAEIKAAAAARDAWMELLRQASRLVDAADGEIGDLRERRDAAMLSLFFYQGKRGVDQAAGLSPTTWYEMRSEALGIKDMGGLTREDRERLARQPKVKEVPDEPRVKEVPDAEQVIADTAPKVLTLTGYREVAFAQQKRAALYLHGILGVTEPEIREVTGRSEDTFWQWRHQARLEAKKGRTA